MTVFDERPASSLTRRRLPLLGLPVLAGLVWIVAVHSPHGVTQTLREFRGDTSLDPGPNKPMADALVIRRELLRHPGLALSPAQCRTLVGYVGSPVNEQSQSEALDVLSMADRARALSAAQARDAEEAALQVLGSSPGPMVRLEAARLLGHLGSAAGVPALTALQQDGDPKVRQAAGEALARLAAPKKQIKPMR